MAILNKIRQRSLILILVIAMALFAFILADVFKNSDGFGGPDMTLVATVNDIDIERVDFDTRTSIKQNQEESYNQALASQGKPILTKRTNRQTWDIVWDEMLQEVIFKKQHNEAGISVSRNQIMSIIKNSEYSTEFLNTEGLFDENKLSEFIANLKEISPDPLSFKNGLVNYDSWTNIEYMMKKEGLNTTYDNLIKSGLRSTLFDAKINYHFQNDNADIKFLYFPFSSVPDSIVPVSKEELRSYIEDNSKKYSVEKSRNLIYTSFDHIPSEMDEKDTYNKLMGLIDDKEEYNSNTNKTEKVLGLKNTNDPESFLNKNSDIELYDDYVFENDFSKENSSEIFKLKIGGLYGPYKEGSYIKVTKLLDTKMISDSTEFRHILIDYVGSLGQTSRTKEQAKVTADSVYRLVKKNKNNFDKLLNLSSDRSTNQLGGIWKRRYNQESWGEDFRQFSFESKVGGFSLIESIYGFHIVEILSKTKKRKAVKVANLGLTVEYSKRTDDSLYNLAQKFQQSVSKSDFKDVANEYDYSARTINSIKELDENIPGIGPSRILIKNWLYSEDTNVGDITMYKNLKNRYVVAKLTSINNAGLMSNQKASPTALPLIINKKKADLIIKKIKGKTLTEISKNQNKNIASALSVNISSPTLSGVGNEPKVIGASFGLEVGQTSKAILGNRGVFYVYLEKLGKAKDLPNYSSFADNLSKSKISNFKAYLIEALKEASDIDDKRNLFY